MTRFYPSGAAGQPSAQEHEAAVAERRRGYRQPTQTPSKLQMPADGGATREILVHIFNLSMYDVGFSSPAKLVIGQVCRLALPSGRAGTALLQVCSVRPRPDGLFDIGGRFC